MKLPYLRDFPKDKRKPVYYLFPTRDVAKKNTEGRGEKKEPQLGKVYHKKRRQFHTRPYHR